MTDWGVTDAVARYSEPWRQPFETRVARALVPGVQILDIGSGRRPAIPPERRPIGCRYVGLDLSMDELEKAPAGSYDEMIASDVTQYVAQLESRFDLIVSWQVLEHVRPLPVALENARRYLRPGGLLVAHLSGKFSLFGLVNQLVPQRVAVWVLARLLHRDPATIFPAHYDQCWYRALLRCLAGWSAVEVIPRYKGGDYLAFSPRLRRIYLVYENWIQQRHPDLATHYLISARG